ncbi:Hint domain-containing protein [Yoonia sp. SS1-5]|uniref:Hint domain-containing protein n=1 Tax=Yoonia rhodophyticola TaxID=3137370 RepID=A0AAN0MCY4_9RHOB
MVSLSGPTTATISEDIDGAGTETISGVVANNEPGAFAWLAGGYTVVDGVGAGNGTLTIVQNTADGEGGYTWTYTFDSDDPFLDDLDDGETLTLDFTIRVTDVSYTPGGGSTVNGTQVVDTHTVTITINGRNEVCFTPGTEIMTPSGPVLIENLRVGDMVLTRDNGAKPIRWIASAKVGHAYRRGNDNLEPIMIAAGAISPGVPAKDLVVSPQHRVLLTGQHCDLLFGEQAILASAKNLLNGDTIRHCGDAFADLEYWHMMFDDHEIVFANGCPTESLYFGDVATNTLPAAQLAELRHLFGNDHATTKLAFPELKAHEAAVLMASPSVAKH